MVWSSYRTWQGYISEGSRQAVVLQKLWQYSIDAVELHLAFLSTAVKGAETHSVLVTDIPGPYAGTD